MVNFTYETPLATVSDQASRCVMTTAKVMANGDTLFTITGGPIIVEAFASLCITANDTTASTYKVQADGTDGAATDLCAATATLASKAAGCIIAGPVTNVATAPTIGDNGVVLAPTVALTAPAGAIKLVIGVGSTTGTWKHFLRYRPLAPHVTVTPGF